MTLDILKKNLPAIIAIFACACLCMILTKAVYRSQLLELLSNDLYRRDVTHYRQEKPLDPDTLQRLSGDTFVSKELSDEFRGIYFSDRYRYEIPMEEGRFFRAEDFRPDHPVVVVGSAWKRHLTQKNGKQYWKMPEGEREYEVLGVAGYEIGTRLEQTVFFNLFDEPVGEREITILTFGSPKESVEQAIRSLKAEDRLTYLDIPYHGISRLWSASNLYLLMNGSTFFCVMAGVLFLLSLRSRYYRLYHRTFHILGFSNRYRVVTILGREYLFFSISFCSGSLLTYALLYESYFSHRAFYEAAGLIMGGSFLLIVLFTSLMFVKSLGRRDVA